MPPATTMAPRRSILTASRCVGVLRCQYPWAAAIPTGRRAMHIPRSGKMGREITKEPRGMNRGESSVSEATKVANKDFFDSGATPMFPGTFVSAPLSDQPKSPVEFLEYQWLRLRTWVMGLTTIVNIKFQSMETFTSRPRWKAQRGRIGPTAKAMYASMLEAFAAGDKRALQRLCTPNFAGQLTSAVDRRSKSGYGLRIDADFKRSLFYPGLRSHMISQYNPQDRVTLTEQAVVALSSDQSMTKYAVTTGKPVPGSTKVQSKVEYVVLMRNVNNVTYEKTDWRIWGTTTPTTLEKYRIDESALQKEQASKAGW